MEREHRLNLTDENNATADTDGDQLTQLEEFARGTNPHLTDTDFDGLDDNVETNTGIYLSAWDTGTDPLNADTDLDGLSDYFEVTN